MTLQDFYLLGLFFLCFVFLYTVSQLLFHIAKLKVEYTRKLVHFLTGVILLGFPVFMKPWQVFLTCISFFAMLFFSYRFHYFQSVNNVNRKSLGTLLYPAIILVCYLFYLNCKPQNFPFHRLLIFDLPILLLAVCDPIAALTGNWYKSKYRHTDGKTWLGTLCFAVSAFLLTIGMLSYFTIGTYQVSLGFLFAGATAVVTSLAERFASNGWDNITVPASALCLLCLLMYFL